MLRIYRVEGKPAFMFYDLDALIRGLGGVAGDNVGVQQDVVEALGFDGLTHYSIGWDNNPRFLTFRPGIVTGNEPEKIEKALLMARSYCDAHPGQAPLITLNSWNEWTETIYFQPDDLYGYGYLEAVRHVFIDD